MLGVQCAYVLNFKTTATKKKTFYVKFRMPTKSTIITALRNNADTEERGVFPSFCLLFSPTYSLSMCSVHSVNCLILSSVRRAKFTYYTSLVFGRCQMLSRGIYEDKKSI